MKHTEHRTTVTLAVTWSEDKQYFPVCINSRKIIAYTLFWLFFVYLWFLYFGSPSIRFLESFRNLSFQRLRKLAVFWYLDALLHFHHFLLTKFLPINVGCRKTLDTALKITGTEGWKLKKRKWYVGFWRQKEYW